MRLFVTGTDTGVGKTAVTACLARAARAWGTVSAVKPVASGRAADGTCEDAVALGEAAGHAPTVFAAFDAPLSPHRAAALEGREVGDEVLAAIAGVQADTVLVEGVGGWRVPLRTGARPLGVVDLARATGGRVLVVAADRLGTLNHTLLTVDAVRRDGFIVAGVVLNRGAAPADASRATNLDDLVELLDVPVAVLEPLAAGVPLDRAGAALWGVIGRRAP